MIFLPSGARGQAVTATLVGSITDPGGAVVPNAPASITNQDTGAVTRTKSNESGTVAVALTTQCPYCMNLRL